MEVTIWGPVDIVGGAVYIYIPEGNPAAAWLKDVCDEGVGKPDERRGGMGGPTGIPLPNPNGGKQSPAAAALLKSILNWTCFYVFFKCRQIILFLARYMLRKDLVIFVISLYHFE